MPNFIITNTCNLSCPFCFASEHMDGESSGSTARMSVEEFEHQLAFAGVDVVRFCGGEPTLHPSFVEMLTLALAKPGRMVFLMTNGVWPRRVWEHIRKLSWRDRRRVGYLFNVLPSSHYRPEQEQALHQTLGMVRRRYATLGVTLYERHYDYQHLFALADRFRFRRVRYSVASPNVSDPRSWNVDPQRDFPELAKVVYGLTMEARRRGIYVHSDCGYLPPCMFTEEQLANMYPPGDPDLEDAFSCRGPVDIGPGGEAWRCYGLYSSMRARTEHFASSRDLSEYFERRTRETTFTPLYDACATCELRERYHCAGGCYALRSVKGLQQRAQDALVQIGDDPQISNAIPRLRQDTVHVTQRGSQAVVMLRESDGTWAQMQLTPWELRVLLACDGARTVTEVAQAANQGRMVRGPLNGAARALRRFFEQGAIELSQPATHQRM